MIVFENVSKLYPNGVIGLEKINLTIDDGEFVSIIGLSGAGKSTFLRAINRLVSISEGDIIINQQSVTKAGKKDLRLIRRNIGLISQSFNLVKRSTVQKNILSGRLGYYSTLRSIFGLFTEADYQRTNEALESVGLTDKLQTRCDELSGGQLQRCSILRALLMKPDLLLVDEPTSALDNIIAYDVMKLLITLLDNCAILLITHDLDMAKWCSDKIIRLEENARK